MGDDNELMRLYDNLVKTADEIRPYYDIDKVKWDSVYIWTKESETDEGENVFDIQKDEIVFYVKDHQIIEEAKPIIRKIQARLKALFRYIEQRSNKKEPELKRK